MEAMELRGGQQQLPPLSHGGQNNRQFTWGARDARIYNWMFRRWRANWLRCLLRLPPQHPFFSFILVPIPPTLFYLYRHPLYLFFIYSILTSSEPWRKRGEIFLLNFSLGSSLFFSFFHPFVLFCEIFLFPFSLLELSHGFVYRIFIFYFRFYLFCFSVFNVCFSFEDFLCYVSTKTPLLDISLPHFCFSFRVKRFRLPSKESWV